MESFSLAWLDSTIEDKKKVIRCWFYMKMQANCLFCSFLSFSLCLWCMTQKILNFSKDLLQKSWLFCLKLNLNKQTKTFQPLITYLKSTMEWKHFNWVVEQNVQLPWFSCILFNPEIAVNTCMSSKLRILKWWKRFELKKMGEQWM